MLARQGIGSAVFVWAAIGVNLGAFSCSAESTPTNRGYAGSPAGGASGNSGAAGAGGSLGAGAFSGSGMSTGGTANGGGGSPTGSGGSGQFGSGGSSGTTGGSTGIGGGNTGGSANSGGSTGTGGSNGSGGSGGNTSCTDTPPPNGDTCAHAVEYGWCGQPWMNGACAASCRQCTGGTGGSGGSSAGTAGRGGTGGSSGSTGGTGGSSGSGGSGVQPPPPITSGGQNGWLSRYWDCCKPACGWRDNAGGTPMRSCGQQNQSLSNSETASACPSPGSDRAFMCWSGAPWEVGDRLAYGFVAASGSNYHCGRCYQIDFTGEGRDDASPQRIRGKTMIVQVINNGGVAGDQLDLLVPGGGVGDFAAACPAQWGQGVALGDRFGGFRRTCGDNAGCVRSMCEAAFGTKPDLMAGCNWFLAWYSNVNNPRVVFKQIACPAAITQRSGMPDRP